MIKLKQIVSEQYTGTAKKNLLTVRQLKSDNYQLLYGVVDNEPISNIKDLPRFNNYMMIPSGFEILNSDGIDDKVIIKRGEKVLKTYVGELTPSYAIIYKPSNDTQNDDGVEGPGRRFNIIYPVKQSPNTTSNRSLSEKLLANWEKGLYQNTDGDWVLYAKSNFTKLTAGPIKQLAVRELVKRFVELQPDLSKQTTIDLRFKFDRFINNNDEMVFWIFNNDRDRNNSSVINTIKPGEWAQYPETLDQVTSWRSGAFYVELQLSEERYNQLLNPEVTKYSLEHPRGTYTNYLEDGDKWIGDYTTDTNGKPMLHGEGVYIDKDGNTYDGTFKDGLPVKILVKVTYGDGATYEGGAIGDPKKIEPWLRHGEGVFVNMYGKEFRGKFENDVFIK